MIYTIYTIYKYIVYPLVNSNFGNTKFENTRFLENSNISESGGTLDNFEIWRNQGNPSGGTNQGGHHSAAFRY